MGRDKARLKLGGSTLLARVKRIAGELGLRVRTIRRDAIARCGPLGGIYTGLITSEANAELFLACDMPFVECDLLEQVINKHRKTGKAVFVRCGGKAGFPLLLPREAASAVKAQIDRKRLSVQQLASNLNAAFVAAKAREAAQLMNINTLEQWEKAVRQWEDDRKMEDRKI